MTFERTEPESSSGPSVQHDSRPDGATPRILLVDDDPINQTVATNLIRRRGWQAVAAANGKEALEKLNAQSFDVILLDLQMPEMDGFQTASAIRETEARKSPPAPASDTAAAMRTNAARLSGHVPIIALTTVAQPGTREKCLAAGMDDYLTKPINPRDLVATIEKHIPKSS